MPFSRIKTWISGEVLTAADLNAEFDNVVNNMVLDGIVGAVRNLVVTYASASTLTVTADQVVLQTSTYSSKLFTGLSETVDITASGANGLDTGAEAPSTWYYLFAIGKSDGTLDAILSTSTTTPTLPSGYTYWAFLGCVYNDGVGPNFKPFKQIGRTYNFTEAYDDNDLKIKENGTNGSPTAITMTAFLPNLPLEEVFGHWTAKDAAATLYMNSIGTPYVGKQAQDYYLPWSVPAVVARTIYYWVGGGQKATIYISGFRFCD